MVLIVLWLLFLLLCVGLCYCVLGCLVANDCLVLSFSLFCCSTWVGVGRCFGGLAWWFDSMVCFRVVDTDLVVDGYAFVLVCLWLLVGVFCCCI